MCRQSSFDVDGGALEESTRRFSPTPRRRDLMLFGHVDCSIWCVDVEQQHARGARRRSGQRAMRTSWAAHDAVKTAAREQYGERRSLPSRVRSFVSDY